MNDCLSIRHSNIRTKDVLLWVPAIIGGRAKVGVAPASRWHPPAIRLAAETAALPKPPLSQGLVKVGVGATDDRQLVLSLRRMDDGRWTMEELVGAVAVSCQAPI